MVASGMSFFGMMVLFLVGGGIGLPLALPPLPEDPVLSRVAPEECLWYFSWSGVAEADLKSKNQTEQFVAEPETKQFISMIGREIGNAIQKGAPNTPQGKVLGEEGPKLLHALITHPTAAFVSKVSIEQTPDVSGGIVVSTGEQTDEIKASLEKIEKVLLGDAANNGDAKWHKLPRAFGAPLVEWGFRGKYLMVGIGAGSADEMVNRGKSQPPTWLTHLKKRLPVERVSSVHYINVKKILETAQPFLGDAQQQAILDVLGVSKIQAVGNVTGLDATGYVGKTWVAVDGEPNGLLGFFGPEPLTPADIKPIPKDASFGFAARVQPVRLLATFLESLNKIDPHAAEQAASGIQQAEAALGFRIKEDLLETLGDSWCVYNSPGEGGLLFTGLTVVVPVKNRDRLMKTNDSLVQLARLSMVKDNILPGGPNNFMQRRRGVEIKDARFQGQQIFYLNTIGEEMPFAPAWCISDKHLVFSLSPQNIRAFLSRDAASGSLADIPAVAEQFKSSHPVVVSYQDTASTLKLVYPIVQIFATMATSQMQREGLNLDASLLPSLPTLLRHAEPGVSSLSREKDGLLYVNRQTLPINGSVVSLLPIYFFLGVRTASQRFDSPAFEEQSIRAVPDAVQPIDGPALPPQRVPPPRDVERPENSPPPGRVETKR